jgi:hypothetical protein
MNLLDYSSLPSRSRLICQIDDDVLRIELPPIETSRAAVAMVVAGFSLALCTAALVASMLRNASVQTELPRDLLPIIRLYVGFPITILFVWAAASCGSRMLWRRLRTPTSISISDDELTLVTPNEFTLVRDWPAGGIEKVEARSLGVSMSLHSIGELCIIPLGGKCISVLRGLDFRELQWAANQLNQWLGI